MIENENSDGERAPLVKTFLTMSVPVVEVDVPPPELLSLLVMVQVDVAPAAMVPEQPL